MSLELAVLSILHVMFGALFFGAVIVLNAAVAPLVITLPFGAMREFITKFWARMARLLHTAIGGTALFGILLYIAGDFHSEGGVNGMLLDTGALLGLLAIIIGEGLQIPTISKLVKSVNQDPTQQSFTPDQQRLLNRVKVNGLIGLILVALAVVCMIASASY